MSFINLKCKDCDQENEIYCDGDNAMMCPECRSVDNFEEVEQTDEELARIKKQREFYNAPKKQNIDQVFTDIFSAHFPGLK